LRGVSLSGGCPVGAVLEATEQSLGAATHLTDMDAGAVQALRVLAAKIDALSAETVESMEDLKAKFDNVTIPTYLKYCESLGLTPAGRDRLNVKKDEGGKPGGKLVALQGGVKRPAGF
jgi:hypothetical protein